ncbi:hypothetical protein ACMFMG_005997 [Clarireedia jacksonii]
MYCSRLLLGSPRRIFLQIFPRSELRIHSPRSRVALPTSQFGENLTWRIYLDIDAGELSEMLLSTDMIQLFATSYHFSLIHRGCEGGTKGWQKMKNE